jgi:hypothetical protein
MASGLSAQTRGVQDPGHGPYARAGDHIDDDAILIEGVEHTQVRHAAGTPAAQGDADLDTPQVMDQALHVAGMHLAPGMRQRRFGDFEFPAREVVEFRYHGGHAAALLQQPHDRDLVAPACDAKSSARNRSMAELISRGRMNTRAQSAGLKSTAQSKS